MANKTSTIVVTVEPGMEIAVKYALSRINGIKSIKVTPEKTPTLPDFNDDEFTV